MKKLKLYLVLLSAILLCACGGDNSPSSEPTPTPSPTQTSQGKIEIPTTEDTKPIISQKGGSTTIKFNATGNWTASSTESWCTISPSSGQSGSNTITITTKENDTYDDRATTITLKSGSNSQTITLSQVQKDAIVLALEEQEIDYNTSTLDFTIQTNVEIKVTISEDAKEWITQATTRSLHNETLHFDISPNKGEEERVGIITLQGGEATQKMTIKQSGDYLNVERLALMALYKATDGDNWKQKDNWGSDKPLDEWYGITTGDQGRVFQIKLPDNNLKGAIPPEITKLKNLWSLGLIENEITSFPDNFGELSKLWELVMSGNKISNLPNSFKELNIASIHLDRNLFTSYPEVLSEINSLKWFTLSWNKIEGGLPESISKMPNLEGFSFSGNLFTGTIPRKYFELENLKSLDLQTNKLDDFISLELQQSALWQNCNCYFRHQVLGHSVIIEGAVESISLNAYDITLHIGETFQLKIESILPEDALDKTIRWEVRDMNECINFDDDGTITALKEGDASIFCYASGKNPVFNSCVVRILP